MSGKFHWHRWFAWRPVLFRYGGFAWLETIERRGGYDHSKNSDRPPPWRWKYRPLTTEGKGA